MNDHHWMALALQEAAHAQQQGEVPVGAVLVDSNNQLIGRGRNQVITQNDCSAHAEIVALRDAGNTIKNYRLNNTTLYVTLEPCPMCASALIHARIHKLVFACRDFKCGAAGSAFNLMAHPALNHQIEVHEGILYEPCHHLIQKFFANRR